MIVATIDTADLKATYYSNVLDESAPTALSIMLNDFDDMLPEGQCMAVTVDSRGDVARMEYLWPESRPYVAVESRRLCWNTMKAFCQAYGLEIVLPEYVGPYTIEAARRVHEDCGDEMEIIPAMEEGEVLCAG